MKGRMTSCKNLLSVTLVLIVTASTMANAEIGPYIGGSVGQSHLELDLPDVGGAGFRIDDEDFAFKVFFGLELPGPIAVEAGYRDLGSVIGDDGFVRLSGETDGFDAFLLGKLPVGPVALFAKAGLIAWDAEATAGVRDDVLVLVPEGTLVPDVRFDDDGTDFAWGVGISGEVGPIGIRGEFESLEIDLLDDVTMLSVGITYEF